MIKKAFVYVARSQLDVKELVASQRHTLLSITFVTFLFESSSWGQMQLEAVFLFPVSDI